MKIPFDIKYRPQIESGEYKVETRDGRPARIICWDIEYYYPQYKIGALIKNDAGEDFFFLTEKGYFCIKESGECDSNNDLLIVTPEEELTEFEQEVSDIVEYCKKNGKIVAKGYAKRHAKSLLILAREQFIKDGYVIEKKAFHDAVKKVDPEVMKEVSDNIDRTEFEQELVNFFNEGNAILPDKDGMYNKRDCEEFLHKSASKLLATAEKELSTKYRFSSDMNGFAYGKGFEDGKKDALKDLPKWKKIGQGNNYSSEAEFCINGRYLEMNDTLNDIYEIFLKDLEKLPKEDEK